MGLSHLYLLLLQVQVCLSSVRLHVFSDELVGCWQLGNQAQISYYCQFFSFMLYSVITLQRFKLIGNYASVFCCWTVLCLMKIKCLLLFAALVLSSIRTHTINDCQVPPSVWYSCTYGLWRRFWRRYDYVCVCVCVCMCGADVVSALSLKNVRLH